MLRYLAAFLAAGLLLAADDQPTFKSDVAMTRVDAQVTDGNGKAVTGLEARDFVLKVNGKAVPIRNFASENMPIDILLLLDVSGSMRPHVESIANAAQQALNVLAPKDRIAVMIFDTSTRVRLPFASDHSEIERALNRIVRSESFNGGTRITGAMLSAAHYVEHNARPEARRAIVILTDDETQDSEDEPSVERALSNANAVLSFLQAPYEPPTMHGGGVPRRHGTWGSGGGGWPGGGGIGFPGGGGIGFPGGRGGMGYPGGGDRSHTAGTANIAQDSGGDTMNVDDASSLEQTLARLRQRYALYFYLPEGASGTDRDAVRVDLTSDARIRFSDAEIHYRRVFLSGSSTEQAGPTRVTHAPDPAESAATTETQPTDDTAPKHHRVAVNEDSGPTVNTVDPGTSSQPH
ncbi:MAG TPA: VWA domain-containing protein [Bryobacteraceae bacterium]|jgi:hypothetical protein|nr:VWA domain-containing protein [Bryobacteraceae bacterium]